MRCQQSTDAEPTDGSRWRTLRKKKTKVKQTQNPKKKIKNKKKINNPREVNYQRFTSLWTGQEVEEGAGHADHKWAESIISD